MHHYIIFGLHVQSYLELPGCITTASDRVPDVFIRQDKLTLRPFGEGRTFIVPPRSNEYFFHWDWIGTFMVRNGAEIVIDPAPEADNDRIAHALPGVIFGGLLHQRGYRVLHASSVVIDDVAVAFVGPKYAGKSTMSAALCDRGHHLLTDDTLAIEITSADEVRALPGFSRLHLWPDSLEALGFDVNAERPLYSGGTKRGLASQSINSQSTFPLAALYVLEKGESIQISPVAKRDALAALIPHLWAYRFMSTTNGLPANVLSLVSPIVQAVSVRHLRRREALDQLECVSRAVEDDVVRSWNQR